MDNTHYYITILLRKFIGVGIGARYEKNYYRDIFIELPFVCINFSWPYKKDRQPTKLFRFESML